MFYQLLKNLVLPPAGLLLLVLVGILWWRRPLLGRGLAFLSTLALLALSLPIVAVSLMAGLEPYPALGARDLRAPEGQAIIVLGAGRYTAAPEFGGDDIGSGTLQRVRYAAWLQKRTGLPLFVSGGSPPHEHPPLARLMKRTLEQEFGVEVAGVEDRSQDTFENALNSARLLTSRGIGHVFLVSHAWHLPRAVKAFERTGMQVTPAPTAFVHRTGVETEPTDFLPSASALSVSRYAVHEYLGGLWYRVRGAMGD